MSIKILHRNTAAVLWDSPCSTMREAVLEAISKKADLRSANLSYANLRSADLSYADLSYANLRSADLSYADLRSADLRSADLRSANLSYANLSYADLRSANLRSANLRSANLRYADLRSADLRSANLSYANLSYANLRSANLRSADLRSADLRSANLSYANLSYAKNAELAIAMTRILPEGEIIGYKKARCVKTHKAVIVQLLIPTSAKRSHAFGRKCRASEALVTAIDGTEHAMSGYDSSFKYKVGDVLKPTEKFEDDFTQECASGIHFFLTKEEASDYSL